MKCFSRKTVWSLIILATRASSMDQYPYSSRNQINLNLFLSHVHTDMVKKKSSSLSLTFHYWFIQFRQKKNRKGKILFESKALPFPVPRTIICIKLPNLTVVNCKNASALEHLCSSALVQWYTSLVKLVCTVVYVWCDTLVYWSTGAMVHTERLRA